MTLTADKPCTATIRRRPLDARARAISALASGPSGIFRMRCAGPGGRRLVHHRRFEAAECRRPHECRGDIGRAASGKAAGSRPRRSRSSLRKTSDVPAPAAFRRGAAAGRQSAGRAEEFARLGDQRARLQHQSRQQAAGHDRWTDGVHAAVLGGFSGVCRTTCSRTSTASKSSADPEVRCGAPTRSTA